MAFAGYSGNPLLKKLGIKPELKLLLINQPANYFDLLGEDLSEQVIKSTPADLVHIFATSRKELEKHFNAVIKKLPSTSTVWISWYKKSAKIPTDITEDTIREIVLPTGWVDIKVCAVSDIWSGLKIVKRVSQR